MALAATAPGAPAVAAIATNDNRVPAGIRVGETLELALDATTGRWAPDGPAKPTTVVDAFAQAGHAPQVPGPLIRVPVGTDIRVRVRNTLAKTLYVHNLVDLPSRADRPLVVAAGGERVVRVHAYAPGTYLYWAATSSQTIDKRYGPDSLLSGAIVVDPPHTTAHDRVFVINVWDDVLKKNGKNAFAYAVYSINGRPWPFTERLAYDRGSTATWRLVNASAEAHPMHLHGFPFTVLDRGTGTAVTRPVDEREVTELLEPGATSSIRFRAARPGAWMFHCHIAYHMLPHNPQSLAMAGQVDPGGRPFSAGQHLPMRDMAMDGDAMNASMGGLVLSLVVRDPKNAGPPPPIAPERRLRLIVEPGAAEAHAPNDPVYPSFRYALADPATKSATTAATVADVGPMLVLARGVPTGITVENHLAEATSVHWHGIELQDSYQDGGGLADPWHRPSAMIMPGAQREARFVAPRAGTFMYHTHMDDAWQLGGGLVGPLIVLEPGETFDASRDHIVLVTSPRDLRTWDHVNVNGRRDATPIEMTVGVDQRLRLLNLTQVTTETTARLLAPRGEVAPPWTLLARDGMALRKPLAVPGAVPFTIGATRDLAFRPTHVGDLTLEIRDGYDNSIAATIPIHVVAAQLAADASP